MNFAPIKLVLCKTVPRIPSLLADNQGGGRMLTISSTVDYGSDCCCLDVNVSNRLLYMY